MDFIISYIREEASPYELVRIRKTMQEMGIVSPFKTPDIVPEKILENLVIQSKRKFEKGEGKLFTIKYVKDVTGWGLKECKDWCDINIFI